MIDFLNGLIAFMIYIIPMAIIMLSVRAFTKIPDELFRKILHCIFLGAYIPLLFGFKVWWHSVIFIISLAIILFPILIIAGKIPEFSAFVNERRRGEFTNSMVLALGVMAVSTSIGWGIFNDKFLVLASVYAWGVGDAFAALIGKRFGKHKISWKFVDNKKSVEGSLAMVVCSTIAVFIVLLVRGGMNPILTLAISLLVSLASAFVELCSRGGYDTIFCPAISMVILIPLLTLLGG